MISTVSSARSWPIFVPAFFMIEVVALGAGVALRLGGGPAHGQAQRLCLHLVAGDARAQVAVGEPPRLVDADVASWPASPRPLDLARGPAAGPVAHAVALVLQQALGDRPAAVQRPDQVLLRRPSRR